MLKWITFDKDNKFTWPRKNKKILVAAIEDGKRTFCGGIFKKNNNFYRLYDRETPAFVTHWFYCSDNEIKLEKILHSPWVWINEFRELEKKENLQ